MHYPALPVVVITHEFCEPDELLLVERPDENAALEECGAHPSDCVYILAAVGKGFALPQAILVVDSMDAFDKGVVEWHFAADYALLFGSSNHIPRLTINLLRPPLIEGRNWHCGKIVPQPHGIVVLRCRLWEDLHEREQIDSDRQSLNRLDNCWRVE